jgi:hypothetical protein
MAAINSMMLNDLSDAFAFKMVRELLSLMVECSSVGYRLLAAKAKKRRMVRLENTNAHPYFLLLQSRGRLAMERMAKMGTMSHAGCLLKT